MGGERGSSTILMVGDLILDEPDPDSFFEPCAGILRSADFVVGHVEVPHTDRGVPTSTDVPAPPADPAHLPALKRAGFGLVTLAGNHMHDSGPAGIEDTVTSLRGLGIATAGAGRNLAEAREPAVAERGGVRVGVLSYNCVGPREGWATAGKAGCAYVHVLTHYESSFASPGMPPDVYTFPRPDTVEAMANDVMALRERCDVLAVALHKGTVHVPARVEMYESPIARAAIDAGADLVIGHHAHIMRGIEVYRGKPIFHGLGNFVTVTRALSAGPRGTDDAERAAWAERRRRLFGFEPDPDMPFYPFHPESRNAAIARYDHRAGGEAEFGFIPCLIGKDGRPRPVGADQGGREVIEYIRSIGQRAGFDVEYQWRDGWAVALAGR